MSINISYEIYDFLFFVAVWAVYYALLPMFLEKRIRPRQADEFHFSPRLLNKVVAWASNALSGALMVVAFFAGVIVVGMTSYFCIVVIDMMVEIFRINLVDWYNMPMFTAGGLIVLWNLISPKLIAIKNAYDNVRKGRAL